MGLLGKLSRSPHAKAANLPNGSLLEATMAAAALLATADGKFGVTGRMGFTEMLGRFPALGVFDVGLAIELFNGFAVRIRNDPERGPSKAHAALRGIAGYPEGARLALEAGRVLGGAEARLSPGQRARLDQVCALLGPAVGQGQDDGFLLLPRDDGQRQIVITVGNEKGGSGKSTIAMHIVVALLKLGYGVASIDLDGRQATLSRYLANRRAFAARAGRAVKQPLHRRIERARAADATAAMGEDRRRLREAFAQVADKQVIVIDTPGGDCYLTRLAHANADMVITPLNDTLLDIDVLARLDCENRAVTGPSVYCEMVQEQIDRRSLGGRPPFEWVVLRNRVTHVDSHSKREIVGLLGQLSERLGFRLAVGLGERVVFHELFLSGLTLLDLPDDRSNDRNYTSHANACLEFRELLLEIGAKV